MRFFSDKYEVVDYTDDCRSGGEVTTATECKEAAEKDLDLSFRRTFKSTRLQRNCFWHRTGIYFNEDTSIAPSSLDWLKAICVKDPGEPFFDK